MAENKYCNVKNRSSSVVVYKIQDTGVRREFLPGEVKKISVDELEKLSYQSGGKLVINNYFQIDTPEVVAEFTPKVEPEYYLNEEQIVDLILNGSLDEFLDCLDFAPSGVIELVKDLSVKLPISNYEKRQALKDKLGFNVDAAINHVQEELEESKAEEKVEAPAERRVKPENTGRRTQPKIIIPAENK